jgi:hypothetical protein
MPWTKRWTPFCAPSRHSRAMLLPVRRPAESNEATAAEIRAGLLANHWRSGAGTCSAIAALPPAHLPAGLYVHQDAPPTIEVLARPARLTPVLLHVSDRVRHDRRAEGKGCLERQRLEQHPIDNNRAIGTAARRLGWSVARSRRHSSTKGLKTGHSPPRSA